MRWVLFFLCFFGVFFFFFVLVVFCLFVILLRVFTKERSPPENDCNI